MKTEQQIKSRIKAIKVKIKKCKDAQANDFMNGYLAALQYIIGTQE